MMNPLLKEAYGHIENLGRSLGLTQSPATCKSKTGILKRFFRHFLIAGKNYKQITQGDIELYLTVQEWKQDYRAQTVLALNMFYAYLKSKHIMSDSPAEKMNVPFPARKSLVMAPLKKKVRRVLRRLAADKTPSGIFNRLLVELAYGSGLRRSELATLSVEDINLTEQTAHVIGKGKKERIVPLSMRCMGVLKAYLRSIPVTQKPLFVLTNGQRITPGGVGVAIKKSTGLNPHYFRYACATHMLLNGCGILYIQQLLGHHNVTTTQVYTKLDKEDLRKVINAKHPGRLRSVDPNAAKPP